MKPGDTLLCLGTHDILLEKEDPKPKGVTIPVHVDLNPIVLKYAKAQTRRVRLFRRLVGEFLSQVRMTPHDRRLVMELDPKLVKRMEKALSLTEKEPKIDG
jgi:hypothetical protein